MHQSMHRYHQDSPYLHLYHRCLIFHITDNPNTHIIISCIITPHSCRAALTCDETAHANALAVRWLAY